MKNFKIKCENFKFAKNRLGFLIPENLKNLKIVDAVLNVKISTVSFGNNFKVNYYSKSTYENLEDWTNNSNYSQGWENVEYIKDITSSQIIKINISDELQDAIDKSAAMLVLDFESASEVTFENSESDFINIDYISLEEFQLNASSQNIDLGKSGNASINLSSGRLSLDTPLISSDENVLPVSISAKYNSVKNDKLPNIGLPNKWNLNVNQFLIKNEKDNDQDSTSDNKESDSESLVFTYIDENGKSQIIEEKYYYIDENNNKIYVKRNDLKVDLDGNLIYTNDSEGTIKSIETELEAPSGLKLVSSIEGISGHKLVDYEPEELKQIKENIKQLEESTSELNDSINLNDKQLCIYVLSKIAYKKQLANQISQINNNSEYLDLLKKIETIHNKSSNYSRNFINSSDGTTKEYVQKYLKKDNNDEFSTKSFTKSMINDIYNSVTENSNLSNGENNLTNLDKGVLGNILYGEASSIYNIGIDDYDGLLKIQYETQELNEKLYTEQISEDNFISLVQSEINDFIVNNYDDEFKDKLIISNANLKSIYSSFNEFYQLSFGAKDYITINLQIENLIYNNYKYLKKIKEYSEQLTKYKHQQELYEMQVPVHYLYNDNNIIYGFGKTSDENIFRLVLITDAYENAVYFTYESLESNKLESIIDSAEKSIVFEYNNDNLLSTITDSRDRKVNFIYDNNKLVRIEHVDGLKSYFYYDNDYLIAVLNPSGLGSLFEYENNKVKNVSEISFLNGVKNGKITYKNFENADITDTFDFEGLNFKTIQNLDEIKNDSIAFSYNNYKSTTITNSKNKKVTYLFDKYGKTRTIYENNFNENNTNYDELIFKATDFSYQDNKINMKVSALPYAKNYLDDVVFKEDEKSIENAFYLGTSDAICSSSTIPFNYEVNAKFYKIKESETTKVMNVSMSLKNKQILNNEVEGDETICLHRVFMVSGWAKANSAFVIIDEKTKDENNKNIYPDYINNRKFEIRAEITYQNDTNIRKFARQFDWRNTEWQYCSLPLILENKTIESINCYIDYSGNTGDISFTDLTFKQADFEVTEYDSAKRPAKTFSAHSNFITTYDYEDGETINPYQQTITNKFNESDTYVTTYEYTKEGKLLRSIDYNGIVTENVYNNQGVIVKTITYHKDEPANKFYDEKKLDEKGKETASINELGEETASYEYINGTGIISSSIDENGVKTSYGYSPADTLLETSITANGIENTNTYGYNLDFLTSLKHNDFEIGYDYDDQGRIKQINIAGNEYLTKEYGENEETTSLASNEIYRQTFNDNGDVLSTYYKPNENAEETTLVENIYDTYGNIIKTKDFIDKPETAESNEYLYFYDKFGNTIKETNTQHGEDISIENEMDSSHSNINKSTIKIGDETLIYEYDRDETPDAKLKTITLPNGIEQTLSYDKLQRVKNIQTEDYVKQFTYLKNGDRTSNLVSKLQFAIGDVNKDNLTYKYDKKGNITEIRENNKLLARYQYDALSRIIREDNKNFGKTFTYSYDAGGNITQRTEYAFTLIENLDFETPTGTFDYAYSPNGWKDQLKDYNGEKFVYDSLGNPTTYRNKTLLWSHGRQLDYYDVVKDAENNITNLKAKYTYNASGIRTSKAINVNMLECNCGKEECDCNGTFTTTFFLNGSKIIKQHDCCNDLIFYYGADGLTGFHLTNKKVDADFYYKKNAQNDIIGIYSTSGDEIARYEYDAWGNCVVKYLQDDGTYAIINNDYSYNDTTIINRFIAFKNPFRYRSYYYDFETNLYYLNSRYYDPKIGRFLNADDISTLDVTQIALNGLNLYAYCLNNPVNEVDENGYFILTLLFAFLIGAAVGFVTSVVSQGLQKGWKNINWWTVLSDTLFGGISGILAVSGLGATGLFFTQGLVSSLNTLTNGLIEGEVNPVEIVFSFFIGGGLGMIGGKTNIKRIDQIEKSLLKVFKRDLSKSISQGFKTLAKKSAKYINVFVLPTIRSGVTSIWQNIGVNMILNLIIGKYTIKFK